MTNTDTYSIFKQEVSIIENELIVRVKTLNRNEVKRLKAQKDILVKVATKVCDLSHDERFELQYNVK